MQDTTSVPFFLSTVDPENPVENGKINPENSLEEENALAEEDIHTRKSIRQID